MKAPTHRPLRRGGTRSGPQASPAACALYLSLALQPFPSRIAGVSQAVRRPKERAPALSLRKSRRLIIPSSISLRFSSPLRWAPKVPSSRKAFLIQPISRSRGKPSSLSRPKHMLGLALDLPDPLLRYPELLRQLSEGHNLLLVEAIPLDQHPPMALR